MDKKAIERARTLAEIAIRNMPRLIDKIRYRRKPISLKSCYSSLGGYHLDIGVYDYFVEKNIASFKQHLYVASRLKLASTDLDSYQQFETCTDIYFALLSDSQEVINAMACLETPELLRDRHNPLSPHFIVHMWQLAILGDYEALDTKIEKLAKNGRKAERELAAKRQDFFSLLIRSDKQGLEDLLLREVKKKMGNPLVEDFIAETSTYRTKLCWFKGIPVQIESPLVPMELMPIKPLDHYNDVYDFLRPDWVPLRENWFASMKHRFKERQEFRSNVGKLAKPLPKFPNKD